MSVARDDAVPRLGRPSSYSADMALYICEQLVTGRSLRSICAEDDVPDATTVFRWLDSVESFRSQYARAREIQASVLAAETIEIADAATNEDYNTARLRVDARKWYASKLAPKVYGDKVTTEVTGADGGAIRVESTIADDARAVAFLLARARASAVDAQLVEPTSTAGASAQSET